MAHIWFRGDEGIWSAMPLDGYAIDVSAHPPRVLAEGFRLGEDAQAAVIRTEAGDTPVWALLVAAEGGARVNGFAPVAGVRVLEDRDEIRAASFAPLFFSTETPAHVEEFVAGERAIYCGRCRQAVRNGELSVRCPQCNIAYHETDELPCWTYAPTCGFCRQATPLDAGFEWTPEA